MSTEQKVYVAFAGSYSNRGCVGVFKTREDAERASHMEGGDNDVEEHEISEWPMHPLGLPWFVRMKSDGEVTYVGAISQEHIANGGPLESWSRFTDTELGVRLWADSKEEAVKKADKLRLEYLAAGNQWDCPEEQDTRGVLVGILRSDIIGGEAEEPLLPECYTLRWRPNHH